MTLLDQINDDLSNVFFADDDFAVSAGYNGNTINVIFDREGITKIMGNTVVQTTEPQCQAMVSDVGDPELGTAITINSETWYIVNSTPDGTGATILTLSAVQP
jgi:hypothetical protein